MELELTSSALAALIAEAGHHHPEEACGILLGRQGRIMTAAPAANVHVMPRSRFEIDPQALVDAHRAARGGGPEVIGYYHSHPSGGAAPSATDRASASGDGLVWAIVAAGDVRLWRDGPGGFEPLSYAVIAG